MRSLNRPLHIVLQCASNEGIRNGVEAGMGVAWLGETHCQGQFRYPSFPQPPDIAFVIRTAIGAPTQHLSVLLDDVMATLGRPTAHEW